MPSNLPSELIELIASYLSNQEQYKCLLICKNWFDPIHRSLYKTIQIKTRHQFKTLLPQLEKNGKLVRSLYFSKSKYRRVGVTKKELDQLAVVCPYIEILDFHQALWKYIYNSNLLDLFKHLYQLPPLTHNLFIQPPNQLTKLSLFGPIVSDYLFQQDNLKTLLNSTPKLVSLSFNSQQDKSHVIHISITQLEFIHDSLPLLKELELTGSFKLYHAPHITQQSLLQMQVTVKKSAYLLTRFVLKASISPQWIYYFAHKYPRLETLDLELTLLLSSSSSSSSPIETEKESLSFLLKSCSNLNKIELDSLSAKTLMTKRFFDTADKHQHLKEIKMKDLAYNLVSRQDGFFDLLVKRGKNWISGLGTEVIESDDMTIRPILKSLVTLNQLTDLVLCCGHPYFDCELDLILDHCPNLLQLTIRSAKVILSKKDYQQQQQLIPTKPHGLKSISFSTVSFSSSIIFDYLSLKSPYLTKLICYECDQKEGNVIQIHMPQHTFESIVLNGIRLGSSLDQPNIRIISITQLKKKKEPRWYHGNNDMCYPKIHRFNQRQTNQLQQYSTIIQKPTLTFRKVQDILFGSISIQCQSIQHWEFICETTYNEF